MTFCKDVHPIKVIFTPTVIREMVSVFRKTPQAEGPQALLSMVLRAGQPLLRSSRSSRVTASALPLGAPGVTGVSPILPKDGALVLMLLLTVRPWVSHSTSLVFLLL